MNILQFFKSLFSKKQMLKTNNECNFTIDLLGNQIQQGDQIVQVLYNETNRRGYLTLQESYNVTLFDKNEIKQNFIKYDALLNMLENSDKVKAGHKHGYLHVMMA